MIISVLVNIPPLIALLVTLLRIFGMTSRNNTHDTANIANIANIANKTLQTTQLRGGNLHLKWWRQNKMSKCCVFTSHCYRAAPRKKCSGTIQRTSVWQETITHFLLSIFIPSACAGWAGLGWAGLGWAGLGAVRISRIVFYDEWTSWALASTSLALYIYTVIIYTIYIISTELLSSLSTELLFILSICRFPLLLYPQRRRTRWWWPRHSSAVCTNEIAIFLITVQLRCRHRVQHSRNNTRSPEISIIHSQWSS